MNNAALQGRQKTMIQRISRRFFFVLSCAWMSFALGAVAENAPRVHHVFIISFDSNTFIAADLSSTSTYCYS